MRILVVDDEADIRLFLHRALTVLGYEPTACADADEALETLQGEPFPMILLDWMMPRIDGLSLCRRIRAMPGGDLPVILIFPGRDGTDDLEQVLAAGADDYMT